MRILVWNIQFFTNNRVYAKPGKTPEETLANQQSAQMNLDYIGSTVAQADADVFVVLETLSTQGAIGTLASGGGPNGLLQILGHLINSVNPNWCLVPPLRCNPQEILSGKTYTESVGVFWRSDRLTFTGPWVWPGGNGPSVPASNAPEMYDRPWDECVPNNLTAAAQCVFYDSNGSEVKFPNDWNRRPYLTTFVDANGRGLKLFSIHTKPGTDAQTATSRLLSINPAVWTPGPNEVTVFAGDFNLNLIGLNTVQSAAISAFKFDSFNLRAIHQPNGVLPPSRFLPRSSALPNAYLTNQLFDFAFVRYGQNARPNPVLPLVVIDRVAGVPTPGGLPQFTPHMNDTVANIANLPATVNISQGGAIRSAVNGHMVTAFATADPHGLVPMDWFQVGNVPDNTFNDTYQVVAELSTHSLLAVGMTPNLPPATSGGGTLTSDQRGPNVFRQMANFGHLGPPAYKVGTSDHLPVFLIV